MDSHPYEFGLPTEYESGVVILRMLPTSAYRCTVCAPAECPPMTIWLTIGLQGYLELNVVHESKYSLQSNVVKVLDHLVEHCVIRNARL